jgi:acyl carrier protein
VKEVVAGPMSTNAKQSAFDGVVEILSDMTSDWDLDFSGGITGDTRLVADLSFESVEIVQLMGAIEKHFKLGNLAAEELLMQDGRYVEDLTVSESADFVSGRV